MGGGKLRYKDKSRRLMAMNASLYKYGNLIAKVNGKKRHLLNDYIEFFKKLDDPEIFNNYNRNIIANSPQWNIIRKKHITASEVRRVFALHQKTSYIFSQATKYIRGQNLNRGMLLEKSIIDLLITRGIPIERANTTYIHQLIPLLSCTIDGLVMCGDRPLTVIEIKTFKSKNQFESNFKLVNNDITLNNKSRAYYQIQTTISILDVDFGLLVFEYQLKVNILIVNKANNLMMEIYLRYLVPYSIYNH